MERLFDDLVTVLTQAINYENGHGTAKEYSYSENNQEYINGINDKKECEFKWSQNTRKDD